MIGVDNSFHRSYDMFQLQFIAVSDAPVDGGDCGKAAVVLFGIRDLRRRALRQHLFVRVWAKGCLVAR